MSSVFNDNIKKRIGERIRKLRENYPGGKLSRQDLCDLINDQYIYNEDECTEPTHKQRGITEPMLKQWELGLNAIPIEWIPVLCEVFNADAGYFFGEYDCNTKEITDICNETGLSQKAVSALIQMRNSQEPDSSSNYFSRFTTFLTSSFLESEFDILLLGEMTQIKEIKKNGLSEIDAAVFLSPEDALSYRYFRLAKGIDKFITDTVTAFFAKEGEQNGTNR